MWEWLKRGYYTLLEVIEENMDIISLMLGMITGAILGLMALYYQII